MGFNLPEKDFYTITELSIRWNCSENDIQHLIYEQGTLRLAVKLDKAKFIAYADYNDSLYGRNARKDFIGFLQLIDSNDSHHIYCTKVFFAGENADIKNHLPSSDFIYFSKNEIHNKKINYDQGLSILTSDLINNNEFYSEVLCSFNPELFDGRKLAVGIINEILFKEDKDLNNIIQGFIAVNEQNLFFTIEEVKRFEETHLKKNTGHIASDLNPTSTAKTIKSLQKMVLGMAISKYGYDPESEARQVVTGIKKGSIQYDLDFLQANGLALSDDTIRKALLMAKESVYKKIPKS